LQKLSGTLFKVYGFHGVTNKIREEMAKALDELIR
jgi:hypothetical protein